MKNLIGRNRSVNNYSESPRALKGMAPLCAALCVFVYSGVAVGAGSSGCDLNSDGQVNVVDVQLAVAMDKGLLPCTATILGPGVCNDTLAQDIAAASLGGTCPAPVGVSHSVSLGWTPSSSPNVIGYNVYRSTTSGGPYTKLTSSAAAGTSYTDSSVQAGKTYYYVATSVDNTSKESSYSNQTQAIVPSP